MATPELSVKSILKMLEDVQQNDPAKFKALEKMAIEGTKHLKWVPNIGPQFNAYESKADQLLYGGQAGGGKTDILIGKATQRHKRSLILRRLNGEVQALIDRAESIIGSDDGYEGRNQRWYLPDNRLIMFGGCQHPGDEKKYKGEPKDFIGIDEASEFPESVINYVIQWLRTTDKGQQVQLCLSTNPPDSPVGEWLINWFGPWVDPEHPLFPQPDGKLLWFERIEKPGQTRAEFRWSETPFDVSIGDGRMTRALSRTFIRSRLADNPDLDATDYAARLASAPAELRARYERGEFVTEAIDDEFQVISTANVNAAMERWKKANRERPGPPEGYAMTAMGCDIAVSVDRTVLSPRYNTWFAEQIVVPGKETDEGVKAGLLMLKHLRDAAQINIDLGGGYGSSAYEYIKNGEFASILGVKPGAGSSGKSSCGTFRFRNVRAELLWRLREALEPTSGFNLMIPPDPELKEELCEAHWRTTRADNGLYIVIEEKEEIKKRLHRSPDKADALALAWFSGNHRQRAFGVKTRGFAGGQPRMQERADRPRNRYDRHASRRGSNDGNSGEQG